ELCKADGFLSSIRSLNAQVGNLSDAIANLIPQLQNDPQLEKILNCEKMNSICNYFLMSFLFAVIICQFGVKAPRASGNRNRSHQVTNHQVTDVNQLLQTLYELVPQSNRTNRRNPGPAQQIEEAINYIRSLNAQVGNLSDAIANLLPQLQNDPQLEHLTQLLAQLIVQDYLK
uniref:BHLH domain-containing protein n=1 Tax=Meloidogyne javanica TaxID=6303 RepID=A0A915MRJ8_MELJA